MFIVSCGDAAEVFQFIEEAFGLTTFPVEGFIIVTGRFAVGAWWNDSGCSLPLDAFDKGIAVIALIGDDSIRMRIRQQ